MAPLLLLLISAVWCGGVLAEQKAAASDAEKPNSKRQTQYISDPYLQQRQASQQLPPEYLSLLQQLEAQQGGIGSEISATPSPADLQQQLVTTAPQRFISQPPRPQRPRPSPQAEEQRRLQEAVAQKNIREQEVRDDQRRQQAQLEQYYRSQGVDLRQVQQYQRQLQAAQQEQIQAAQQQQIEAAQQQQQIEAAQQQQIEAAQQQQQIEAAQRQQLQASQQQQLRAAQIGQFAQPAAQPQYIEVPSSARGALLPGQRYVQSPAQAQYVEIPGQEYAQAPQAAPERVSYSQVRFGTTKLAPQRLIPQPSQRAVYTQPQRLQPQPQAVTYVTPQPQTQPQPQQLVYAKPEQAVYAQQAAFQPALQRTVDQKQTPEQYLIETTKPAQPQSQEQIVSIPRARAQQIYYRPEPSYQDIQASFAAQHQQLQLQSATTAIPPSRSSIYVSTSRTPVELKPTFARQQIEEVRLPKEERKPLTQSEFQSLINAGFSVTPSQGSATEYEQQASYEFPPQYYKGIGKRHNKPIPRPVSLTEQERQQLAREGISNLYRVETAESQDAPATYVLAIGGPSAKKQ